MKALLHNIRSKTRSPPLGRGRRSPYAGSEGVGGTQDMAFAGDEELDAAVAASLAEDHSFYPAESTSRANGVTTTADDDAAVAAAIGASLDVHEGKGRYDNGGDHSPAPSTQLGSHASQDLAFLTDGPLLPPASAGGAGREGSGRIGYGSGSIWGHDGNDPKSIWEGMEHPGGWNGEAVSEGPAPAVPSSSSRRRAQGVQPATAPGAHCRSRTDEDEELARRLQEQWISEDSAGGGAGGGGGGFQRWPVDPFTRTPFGRFAPSVRCCAGCGQPITDSIFRQGAGVFYHVGCSPMEEPPLPPCRVCHESLPQQDGRIHFYRHNFFNDVYCPWHHDSSARCYSCMRLEPMAQPGGGNEGPFAALQDGRTVCMACAQTAVVDSAEGSPAYQDVCRFFEQELRLTVPREMREVPVLLVDSPTLNEQTHRDQSHGGGAEQGMPTTRGLTLSEVATVMHMAAGSMHFNASLGRFEVGPPSQVKLGEKRAVTAILVLCGLPYASFSSILAHEAMHAWMKLDPSFPSRLPSQVEEGICQLIALLWLEHLAGNRTGDEGGGRRRRPNLPPSNEQLRAFFAHQIKTDISEVYGDGFRKAKAAYDIVGLEALLEHVKQYEAFPAV